MRGHVIRIGAILLSVMILIAALLGTVYLITKPNIKLIGDASMEVTLKEGYKEPGYEAKFAFIDITSFVEVSSEVDDKNAGEYVVEYSVNFLNKTASVKRTVKVVDKEPPVINLNGGNRVIVQTCSGFDDPGYTAHDDSDGDVTKLVKTKGIVDTYHPGTYTICYNVSDSFGNEASERRKVIVKGKPAKKTEKVIYLTFDDGPSETVTPLILEILKKYNVPATFFIIDYGQSDEKLNLIKSAIAQGHTIGIHGYSHDYEKIYKSVSAFMENIIRLDKKIRRDMKYEPFIMRFPGGSSNTVSKDCCKGIMSKLVNEVQKEGYYYTDWDVDSTDASGANISAEQIISSIKKECRRKKYNIVLMHDSDAKQTTVEALPKVIEWAKKEGYTFAAMKKGSPTVHHSVNN